MAIYGKIGIGLVFASMLATALILTVTASASAATKATKAYGTVQCSTGAKVVGIWIEAKNGGSGFANFSPKYGSVSTVNFNRKLSNGGMYRVNVGCGGTPQRWKTNIKSNKFVNSNEGIWFMCHDVPGRSQFCQVT